MSPAPIRGPNKEEPKGRNLLLLRSGITFALLMSAVSVQILEHALSLPGGVQHLYLAVVLS